jgi:hypothetical protein
MGRSLIWIEDTSGGWACSSCRWKFPVPTLLSGKEAKAAYDRLAAAKFRDHACEADGSVPAAKPEAKWNADPTFAERARKLIVQGYKPKDAAELVVQETALENHNDPKMMAKARADAEDFLSNIRKGLI